MRATSPFTQIVPLSQSGGVYGVLSSRSSSKALFLCALHPSDRTNDMFQVVQRHAAALLRTSSEFVTVDHLPSSTLKRGDNRRALGFAMVATFQLLLQCGVEPSRWKVRDVCEHTNLPYFLK